MKKLFGFMILLATSVYSQNADFSKGVVTCRDAVLPNSPVTLSQAQAGFISSDDPPISIVGSVPIPVNILTMPAQSITVTQLVVVAALVTNTDGSLTIVTSGGSTQTISFTSLPITLTNVTSGFAYSSSFSTNCGTAVIANRLTNFRVTNDTSMAAGTVVTNNNTITIGNAPSGGTLTNTDNSLIVTQNATTGVWSLFLPTSNGTITTGYAYNALFSQNSLFAVTWTEFSISNGGNTAVVSIGGTNYTWAVTHTP